MWSVMPRPFSSALGSRLASSLSDLYAADMEEDRKSPYSPPPLSSSSVSLSPAPTSMAPTSLGRYGNGLRSMQQEVNNNSGPYGGPAVPPAGKSFARPGPQDYVPYRTGRYLSRSIPVSPLTQQQLS